MPPAPQASSNRQPLALGHFPSLDALRGVAILMVVFFHGFGAYAWVPNLGERWGRLLFSVVSTGRFGVNGFFVLSGFLITGILLRSRLEPGYYQRFYLRRALRILPAYLLLLIVLRLLHVIDTRFALAAVLFIANFARLFGAPLTEYLPLWSIAVEEQFYLVWPTCVRRLRTRTLALGLVAVIAAEPLLRLLAVHISTHIDVRYKTPFVLDFLAYGALLALLVDKGRIGTHNARRLGLLLLGAGVAFGGLLVWTLAYYPGPNTTVLEDLPFTWAACGLLLLGIARDHARREQGSGTARRGVLSFFGYISYGLYLVHMLVYMLAQLYVMTHMPARVNDLAFFSEVVLGCVAVSTALAYLSRRFYEGPFLRLKGRFDQPPPERLAVTETSAAMRPGL